jgi:RND family efflux transporter MFP subunit
MTVGPPTDRYWLLAARTTTAIALLVMLTACGQENRYVAPPPPKVTVALPAQQKVTRYVEATGYAAAINTTNLVARVQGFLQQIKYKDGDFVKEGTTLFVIEPELYELKLEQAQAAEAGAQATLKQTEAEYERQVELSSRQVATKAALDNATANRDSAAARLKQAQVETKQAALNLGYTQVKAPFDGIVTARLVSLGELVGANGPTQLATIVQTNPIYVNFSINEQEVLSIRADMRRRVPPPRDARLCFSRHRPRDRHARRASHSAERERHAGAGQFRPRAGRRRRRAQFVAGTRRGYRQRPGRALSARRRQGRSGRAT